MPGKEMRVWNKQSARLLIMPGTKSLCSETLRLHILTSTRECGSYHDNARYKIITFRHIKAL